MRAAVGGESLLLLLVLLLATLTGERHTIHRCKMGNYNFLPPRIASFTFHHERWMEGWWMVDGDGALRSDLILKEIGISANIPIKSHFRSKGRYEDAEIKLHFTSTQLEPLIGGWVDVVVGSWWRCGI